ncbi:GspH/FimT family pseudopilin [Pseudomonas sp. SP16.1]|uniref:GspH/FimT family pseudopilin n=1 Tax=Pseudomonas sp. SP16.1 TaxID=3458854 RepID=UPI004045E263
MSQKGFSLIELMVTLAVLAIVLGLAAPSFSSMLQDNRALSLGSELQGALQYARSEAVKRRLEVVICRRNAAGSACDNGADWSAGWLVRQAGGDVLKVWDRAQGMAVAGPNAGVTFRGNGMASATVFSVKPTACTDTQKRVIALSATGATSVTKDACQ